MPLVGDNDNEKFFFKNSIVLWQVMEVILSLFLNKKIFWKHTHMRNFSDIVFMIIYTKTLESYILSIYILVLCLTVKRNCFVTITESKQTGVLYLNIFDGFKLRVTLHAVRRRACVPKKWSVVYTEVHFFVRYYEFLKYMQTFQLSW